MEGVDAAAWTPFRHAARRAAAMLMQTTMFLSQSAIGVNPDGPAPRPLTAA